MGITVDLGNKKTKVVLPNNHMNICRLGLTYSIPFNLCYGVDGFPFTFPFTLK